MIVLAILLLVAVLILSQIRNRLIPQPRMSESEKINVLPKPKPFGWREWVVVGLLTFLLVVWWLS